MSRLGRAQPTQDHHFFGMAVPTVFVNIGDTDVGGFVDAGHTIVQMTNADIFGQSLEASSLSPKDIDSAVFFDTGPVYIYQVGSDVFSSTDTNLIAINVGDILLGSEGSSSISSPISSVENAQGAEGSNVGLSSLDSSTSSETTLIGIFSSDFSFSSDQQLSTTVSVTNGDSSLGAETNSLSTVLNSPDSFSSVEGGAIGYTLSSVDSGSLVEGNGVSAQSLAIDTIQLLDSTSNVQVKALESGSFSEGVGSNFSSSETGSFSESFIGISVLVTDRDSMMGVDASTSTVGSQISTVWNVNSLLVYKIISEPFVKNIINSFGIMPSREG